MKCINFIIIIFCLLISCTDKNTVPTWNQVRIDEWNFNKIILPNQVIIICDSNFNLVSIESPEFEEKDKLYFNSNGLIKAKEKMNRYSKLIGKNYYFHDNGDLKSIVTYKNGEKSGQGLDFYKISGNLQNYIFYDSTGMFYYAENYTDTSTNVTYIFNPNNPNSYQMIKAKIPDPQKSILIKKMERIGLDSLKQIY